MLHEIVLAAVVFVSGQVVYFEALSRLKHLGAFIGVAHPRAHLCVGS
jgi:hypothetical protein